VAAHGSVAVDFRETERWGGRDGVGRFFFLREAGKAEGEATSERTRADGRPCQSISVPLTMSKNEHALIRAC
jgi:hypothetical protein